MRTAVSRMVTDIALALLFLLVVLPVGLLARLVRDPLRRTPDPHASTYWSSPHTSSSRPS